jgi:multisubunit Na+/H+ antiporter MnhB subunit
MPERPYEGWKRVASVVIPALYLFIAGINFISRGWRDSAWKGWCLMAAGFILIALVPEHTRRSSGKTLRHPLGIAAYASLTLAIIVLWYPLLTR